MAGLRLIGENPLRYADHETGAKLEVRSLVDSETGKKVCIVFDGNILRVVQAHGDSINTSKMWKRELKVDENASDINALSKHCDMAEKTRIKSITNVESTVGQI